MDQIAASACDKRSNPKRRRRPTHADRCKSQIGESMNEFEASLSNELHADCGWRTAASGLQPVDCGQRTAARGLRAGLVLPDNSCQDFSDNLFFRQQMVSLSPSEFFIRINSLCKINVQNRCEMGSTLCAK